MDGRRKIRFAGIIALCILWGAAFSARADSAHKIEQVFINMPDVTTYYRSPSEENELEAFLDGEPLSLTDNQRFSETGEPVEYYVLLDISASIRQTRFEDIKASLTQFMNGLRETDSLKRIAYSVANTFLGRMCLSGDVTNLSPKQWDVIERGIAFYRRIAPVIKKGCTYIVSPQVRCIRHPEGWQGVVRVGENGGAYVLIHTFGGAYPETVGIRLPDGTPEKIAGIYSDAQTEVWTENGILYCRPGDNWRAVAVYLKDPA